jgi:hypothetical protein
MDEFDVAVVIFARAAGVDRKDAGDRAVTAVRQQLSGANSLPLPGPGDGNRRVRLAGIRDLTGAAVSGYLNLTPNAQVYKLAGFGAPEREATDG